VFHFARIAGVVLPLLSLRFPCPSTSLANMPPKRQNDEQPTTPKRPKLNPSTTSATSPSPKKPSSAWTASEERRFLEAIDRLVKGGLWAELKSDDEAGKRGANGVRSHWDALVRYSPIPTISP
jgi:hypothetical protein